MPNQFGRPVIENRTIDCFLDEASRLRAFTPPFRFTSFFSPEDTLLCVCASEAALAHARLPRRLDGRSPEPLRIAELTTGSGLVGLHLLRLESGSTLAGFDVDAKAIDAALSNARTLGVFGRTRFECTDLWSGATESLLHSYAPHLLICNPPYVPEPTGTKLKLEAGAGADGTAHLLRTIELAAAGNSRAMALSWCSLSDPARIVREAEAAGYRLNSLFIVMIAEGEYSGSVLDYLRTLPHAYINEEPQTVEAVAPDGSARFAFLLMAGDFSRSTDTAAGAAEAVESICEDFASGGLAALENPDAPVPVRAWLLDRWDEVRLRAFLHGNDGGSHRQHLSA